MITRRVVITNENGETKTYERTVSPHTQTLNQFISQLYGAGRRLIVSSEKLKPGEFCRPYIVYT